MNLSQLPLACLSRQDATMASKSVAKRKRSKNFSEYEKTLLKNVCLKNKIIEDKRSDQMTCNQKTVAWDAITMEFNAEDKITKREMRELKVRYMFHTELINYCT